MKIIEMFCFGMYVLFLHSANAQTIKVGLEPFPPLITQDKKGVFIDMLSAIENISDLKFDISMMNYARAKKELQGGRVDLIGLTPYHIETKAFYQYAQDLDWSILFFVDIYAKNKLNLHPDTFNKLKLIGTPRGNENFFSARYKIPVQAFHGGEIESSLKMLDKNRIELFMFERVSTMTSIRSIGIEKVYYRNIDRFPAGFSVSNNPKGNKLKQKLDSLFKQVAKQAEFQKYFTEFNHHWQLPDEGLLK